MLQEVKTDFYAMYITKENLQYLLFTNINKILKQKKNGKSFLSAKTALKCPYQFKIGVWVLELPVFSSQ